MLIRIEAIIISSISPRPVLPRQSSIFTCVLRPLLRASHRRSISRAWRVLQDIAEEVPLQNMWVTHARRLRRPEMVEAHPSTTHIDVIKTPVTKARDEVGTGALAAPAWI